MYVSTFLYGSLALAGWQDDYTSDEFQKMITLGRVSESTDWTRRMLMSGLFLWGVGLYLGFGGVRCVLFRGLIWPLALRR